MFFFSVSPANNNDKNKKTAAAVAEQVDFIGIKGINILHTRRKRDVC